MIAPGLDHVGVVSSDLAALAATYERLGFTLTPSSRSSDGRIVNRCAMLRGGSYIELLALAEPNARSATLERFLARYAGVHILAFAMADEQVVLGRLHRTGIEGVSASRFVRKFDDADPGGAEAAFVLIPMPEQPEGRFNLVRHLTPSVLWQEPFLCHSNKAIALEDVSIAVAEPVLAAARLSRLVGCVVVPGFREGFALELALGRVSLLPATSGVVPRVTRLTLRTSDGNAAIDRLVNERMLVASYDTDAILIDAAAAGGVEIRFIP